MAVVMTIGVASSHENHQPRSCTFSFATKEAIPGKEENTVTTSDYTYFSHVLLEPVTHLSTVVAIATACPLGLGPIASMSDRD